MASRFTMANMAIEAGAKNGIIEPDITTLRYVNSVGKKKFRISDSRFSRLKSDEGAKYAKVYEYDARKIEPLVALPHLPSNVKPVKKLKGITIDQVVIG